jgi:peptidoglycan/xylan/chitin deacetylase (PgdA/CDA1 family)
MLLLLAGTARSEGEKTYFTLCYHAFLDRAVDYDINPEEFARQIAAIEAIGYRFVTWQDVRDGKIEGGKNILLTIDDANRSVLSVYGPVLKKRGIKPVIFVYPAIISRMDYAMTWTNLRMLAADGVTIGGHGYNHLYVNQKLLDKDPASFRREISTCRKRLTDRMGTAPEAYAYPFGVFSDITKIRLKEEGFIAAFTLRNARAFSPLSANPDPFDLPRYMVTKSSWKAVYAVLKRAAQVP